MLRELPEERREAGECESLLHADAHDTTGFPIQLAEFLDPLCLSERGRGVAKGYAAFGREP